MEWEPNERDAWVADAQRWISQINGVLQCKIDLDESGDITGVHVVAGMERDPRHIVRDVEGLLKARLDLDVYYKKIGVVQVLDNGNAGAEPAAAPAAQAAAAPTASGPAAGAPAPASRPTPSAAGTAVPAAPSARAGAAPPPGRGAAAGPAPIPAILVAEDLAPRVVCGSVTVMTSDTSVQAEVQLRAGEVEAGGRCDGPNHADSDLHLVARAAVLAVAELIADPVVLHLRDVRVDGIGGRDVVLCAVDLIEGRRGHTLYGTCGLGHNRQQAAVYAVLDALNRQLALQGLKSLAAEA